LKAKCEESLSNFAFKCNLRHYSPAKIDSQFVLDFGFADEFCSRPGYVLGPLSIPDSDPNAFDKTDILEVAGLKEQPSFTIRAFEVGGWLGFIWCD